MKHLILVLTALLAGVYGFGQQNPWKKDQVMPTALLGEKIRSNAKDLPAIINVGPMENIKTAIKAGPMNTEAGLQALQTVTAGLDKSKEVVLYCGCCSYSNCPNIGPAFLELEKTGFKNVKVLYIPEGIKPDWTGKGYPVE